MKTSAVTVALALSLSFAARAGAGEDPSIAVCEAIARHYLPNGTQYERTAATIAGRAVQLTFSSPPSKAAISVKHTCIFEMGRSGKFTPALPLSDDAVACKAFSVRYGVMFRMKDAAAMVASEPTRARCEGVLINEMKASAEFIGFISTVPGYAIDPTSTALH